MSSNRALSTELDKKIDVYAYGITLLELLSKKSAWGRAHPAEVRAKVIAGERPAMSDELAGFLGEEFSFFIKLITECWSPDPYMRPHFKFIDLTLSDQMKILGIPYIP